MIPLPMPMKRGTSMESSSNRGTRCHRRTRDRRRSGASRAGGATSGVIRVGEAYLGGLYVDVKCRDNAASFRAQGINVWRL